MRILKDPEKLFKVLILILIFLLGAVTGAVFNKVTSTNLSNNPFKNKIFRIVTTDSKVSKEYFASFTESSVSFSHLSNSNTIYKTSYYEVDSKNHTIFLDFRNCVYREVLRNPSEKSEILIFLNAIIGDKGIIIENDKFLLFEEF